MRTKRLSRQLKKAFGDEAVESRFAAAGEGLPAEGACAELKELAPGLTQLLDSVEESYQQLEDRANLAQRSMEVGAGELTEANARLFRMNQTFDAMLNSLGQAFVIFGPDGVCLPVFSKACEDLLEARPAGKNIAEVLRVPEEKRESFTGWLDILFEDRVDFCEFAKLGPAGYRHSKGKKVSVEYRPVRGSEGRIDFVMAIATDYTKEFEANEKARQMSAHVAFITSVLTDKDRFVRFIGDFRRLLAHSASIVDRAAVGDHEFAELKRNIHTLKGGAGAFGMLVAQTRLNQLENEVAKRESFANARPYLKEELSNLRDLFENMLNDNADVIGDLSSAGEPERRVKLSDLAEFERRLSAGSFDRESVLDFVRESMITVSCAEIFTKFDSVLQETASRLGKKVARIRVRDDGVRIVPEQYPNVFLSLAHVFRNIVDHGIESPEHRSACGKSAAGNVTVDISKRGDRVAVRISDDGAGIDLERVRRKLREMGKVDLADHGSREQILESIFLPGLSTAESVTEISGRGIGMDAVREALATSGGRISVESELGKGTSFVIELPLRAEIGSDRGADAESKQGKLAS